MAGSLESIQALLDYTIQVIKCHLLIQNDFLNGSKCNVCLLRIPVFKTALRMKYFLGQFTLWRRGGDPILGELQILF